MTNPQTLHDIWLILTVVTTLEASGIALYLLRMFSKSSRRWFFWALAIAFASVAIEQGISEIKNLYHVDPPSMEIARLWVLGRAQESIVLGTVLGYLVFGRNGDSKKNPDASVVTNG